MGSPSALGCLRIVAHVTGLPTMTASYPPPSASTRQLRSAGIGKSRCGPCAGPQRREGSPMTWWTCRMWTCTGHCHRDFEKALVVVGTLSAGANPLGALRSTCGRRSCRAGATRLGGLDGGVRGAGRGPSGGDKLPKMPTLSRSSERLNASGLTFLLLTRRLANQQ